MKKRKLFTCILLLLLLSPLAVSTQIAYGAVSSEVGIVFEGEEVKKTKPEPPVVAHPKKLLPQTSETGHSSLNLIGLLLILGVTLYRIKLRIKKQIN